MVAPILYSDREFDVILRACDEARRVAKIIFSSDGSLHVAIMGLTNAAGIAAHVTVPPRQPKFSLDLKEFGKVTNNMVKYSHHMSGEALFSLTGKIDKSIRRRSTRLTLDKWSHTFSLQIQAVSEFDACPLERTRGPLIFSGNRFPRAVKLVCYRDSLPSLYGKNGLLPDRFFFPDGTSASARFISAPSTNPACGMAFCLFVYSIPPFRVGGGAALTFLGGFDPEEVAFDHSRSTGYLMLNYPCENPDDLAAEIGSLDLSPLSRNAVLEKAPQLRPNPTSRLGETHG